MNPAQVNPAFSRRQRTVIVGGPRTGKTTFAHHLGATSRVAPMCTDALIATHSWSEASARVSLWLDCPGPFIIEGVAAVRALRKWLERNRTGKPADLIIAMWIARVPLTDGQERMAKGCRTVWREISPELEARGVEVAAG